MIVGPRILVVNVNWIGDVLFSTPALRAIKKKYPAAFLACLAPNRCQGLLENNPYVDQLLVSEDNPKGLSMPHWVIGAAEIRKKKFETAIFFHRSKTKAFQVWMAGIPERIGFNDKHQGRYLTQQAETPQERLHRTDYFLKLLEFMDIPSDGRTPDFFPKKEADAEYENLLSEAGIAKDSGYAVVHAGGNWDLKRWPIPYFVRWIRLFLKKFKRPVVLCGTSSERSISDTMASHFTRSEVVSLCGKTSLDTLALLLRHASLLLSNDSGPIHMAASQGTKILGLFGPTHPEETGPISSGPVSLMRNDVGCEVPCYFRSCHYRVCMDWLTPEAVFQKTDALLALTEATA